MIPSVENEFQAPASAVENLKIPTVGSKIKVVESIWCENFCEKGWKPKKTDSAKSGLLRIWDFLFDIMHRGMIWTFFLTFLKPFSPRKKGPKEGERVVRGHFHERVGETHHAIPCNTMQYHAVPCSTMQYHAVPCNNMQYRAIPCNTVQYRAIPCNTMQYHVVPCNTMQYPASLITAVGA